MIRPALFRKLREYHAVRSQACDISAEMFVAELRFFINNLIRNPPTTTVSTDT